MKNFKLFFSLLKIFFTSPSVVFKSLLHTVNIAKSKKIVERKFRFEEGLPVLDLLDVFPEFQETVNPFTHLYGTSLPVDMAVLRGLAKEYSSCEYLEIGSWRGESLANVAPFCSRCVSVSLSNEQMRQFGMNERMISMQRYFSRDIKNVQHIEANSREFDFSTLGKFDLIFVDGDHTMEGVRSDTEKVFQLLKSENSVIVWHDYTANYEQINWEVFAGILEGCPAEKRNSIYHISNTLCAVYMNTDLPARKANFPEDPSNTFEISIRGNKAI